MLRPLYFKTEKHNTSYNIVSFDIETHGLQNKFYMGGITDDEGYRSFYDEEEMRKELLSEKYANDNTRIFATNLAFDMKIYDRTIYYNTFERLNRGSSLILAKYKRYNEHKNSIVTTFLDTLNLAPMSLEKLGNIIGIHKLEMPKSIENDNKGYARIPKSETEKTELEIYNKRDCEVTKKFIEFFQVTMKVLGGRMTSTIASTSLDLYQRKFLRFPLRHENIPDSEFKESKSSDTHDFLFKAYAGGRTETYIRGQVKGINGYDVNSLYPFIMTKSYPLPSSARYTQTPNRRLLMYEGVSKCKVSCPTMKYPLLFSKRDKKLLFETGNIKGYYSHYELREAIALGYKVELEETIYYTKQFYPFKDYVETLYALRLQYQKEGNPMQSVVKLLLNSLYGKFGSRHITKNEFYNLNDITREKAIEIFKKEKSVINEETGEAYTYDYEECKSNYVFPIFALYTTAMARVHMHRYMRELDVYYQDTDSLFIKGELPTGNALGEMKLEYDNAECIFIRPKLYLVLCNGKEKIKAKGLQKANAKDFLKILNREAITKQSFTKPRTAIRKGLETGEIVVLKKLFSLEDTKRVWEKEEFTLQEQYSIPHHATDF